MPEFQAHPRHSHEGQTGQPPHQKPPCDNAEMRRNIGGDLHRRIRLPPFSRFNWELSFFPSAWSFSIDGGSTSDSRSGIGGCFFSIHKTLIQTQPVRQDPPFTYYIFAYFIFTIYFTQSSVVERQQAQSSWYQTSFIVWEVRRGVHWRNCEWAGGDDPPPFFRIGLFPLSEKDGSLRRHSAFFGGGSCPPKESLRNWGQQQHCVPSQFLFLASRIPDQIDRRNDDSTLVHRK